MRLLNWYLMRFCVDLLIGYWRTRKRALDYPARLWPRSWAFSFVLALPLP